MNSKLALRLVSMEGIAMVQTVCIYLSLMVPHTYIHFIRMPCCSCLQMGKTFCYFCRLSSKNVLYQVDTTININSYVNNYD